MTNFLKMETESDRLVFNMLLLVLDVLVSILLTMYVCIRRKWETDSRLYLIREIYATFLLLYIPQYMGEQKE